MHGLFTQLSTSETDISGEKRVSRQLKLLAHETGWNLDMRKTEIRPTFAVDSGVSCDTGAWIPVSLIVACSSILTRRTVALVCVKNCKESVVNQGKLSLKWKIWQWQDGPFFPNCFKGCQFWREKNLRVHTDWVCSRQRIRFLLVYSQTCGRYWVAPEIWWDQQAGFQSHSMSAPGLRQNRSLQDVWLLQGMENECKLFSSESHKQLANYIYRSTIPFWTRKRCMWPCKQDLRRLCKSDTSVQRSAFRKQSFAKVFWARNLWPAYRWKRCLCRSTNT